MRTAYFDTFSGISGDMVLGALVDAGLPFDRLSEGLAGLRLTGYHLEEEKVLRGPFSATRIRVVLDADAARIPPGGETVEQAHDHPHDHPHDHDHPHGPRVPEEGGPPAEANVHAHAGGGHPHRGLADILALLQASGLPEPVRERAASIFRRLGEAEAKIHGVPVEAVRFHEVGAVDSIIDVAGSVLGLHLLEIEEVWCAPATVGSGWVRGAHGEIPLPAPATLELLRGFPLRQRDCGFELTTPTGAAISTTLARGFGPMPPLVVGSVGYGAGDDRPGPVPNVLRLVIGERTPGPIGTGTDRVIVLETDVDDMSPQWIGYLVDRLLEAGALDVTVTPVQMKKGRPGHTIRVLAGPGKDLDIADILFAETTTLGIRRNEVDRLILDRTIETVSTRWGEVRIKVGRRGGRIVGAAPEYEDLRRLAAAARVPLKEVHREALRNWGQVT
jgi:uncharacterized protein (TIGR00299 family) protein